jgi:hypothetical protein
METLEQFLIRLNADMLAFEVWWRDNMKSLPDEFPSKMKPGEWNEEYRNYTE